MEDILAQTTQAFLRPISKYLEDDAISEVMINGSQEIYVEEAGKLRKTSATFEDDEQLMAAVRNIAQFVGRKIDNNQPIMDARLPNGSRIHVVLPPCARKGVYMTIRKFSQERLGVKDLIKFGSLSVNAAKFLNFCVTTAKNIIVAGGTSSGKTTLLNVVSSLIPEDQRIVVIEDSSELQLQQEHVLSMETKTANEQGKGEVTMRDLLKSSLRLRPDRIIIGEVRSGEAMDLLQAMNTGHSGSMSTIHANSPRMTLNRLETLALMGGVDLPLSAVRAQIASAVDLVVQASRLRDGSRKVTHITEVVGLDENGAYETEDIFKLELQGSDKQGKLKASLNATKKRPKFLEETVAQGFSIKDELFD